MPMRITSARLAPLALLLTASSPGFSQASPAMAPLAPQDPAPVTLRGNVHPAIASGRFLEAVDRSAPMEKMILALKRSPAAQVELDTFLRDQQDPASPNFHRWLSPDEFGKRFGMSTGDLTKVTDWLRAQGFRINQVTAGRNAIVFSGNAGQVMDAFHTTLAKVNVDDEVRQGNLTDPSIPADLAPLVHGVVSLHNIPRRAMNHGAKALGPMPQGGAPASAPLYTARSGSHFLAPGDFSTIYNTAPLLAKGVDGTGMTIAIAGRTDILRSDVEGFRAYFGLPPNKLAITYNGPNPGIISSGEETEADLDVEWSGAVARNATVEFVVSGSTNTADGVDLSVLYIVDNNLAPVASVSFGQGELLLGQAAVAFFGNVYAQAAAQGQTFFISSGDSGAAGDGSYYGYANGLDVNGMGSSPYNVSVGGTQFNDGAGTYWAAANAGDKSSALGYIPENAWNESGTMPGGNGLWSTGGGYSNFNLQPSWQAPLLPSATHRAVPDVSLTAATHDGYIYAQEGYLNIVGGTSASSPSFAGLMALVVQATGQRQGNANPVLYQLGSNQYTAAGPAVFHDITSGNNSVPGLTGFSAVTGYDACTGLGSVDANAMVSNWITSPATKNTLTAQITSPSAAATNFVGSGTQTFSATATDSNANEILTYTWTFGDGTQGTGASVTHTYAPSSSTLSYPVTLTVTDSTGNLAADTRVVRVSSIDLTHSGTPTLLDLLQWSIYYTTRDPQGDLNGDGVVDDTDLQILLAAL